MICLFLPITNNNNNNSNSNNNSKKSNVYDDDDDDDVNSGIPLDNCYVLSSSSSSKGEDRNINYHKKWRNKAILKSKKKKKQSTDLWGKN